MGCTKGNKNKGMQLVRKIQCIIISILLAITFVTPAVLGTTDEVILVWFDPTGDVDINIVVNHTDFDTVTGGTQEATGATAFTLYNNGSIAMDTTIQTNTSVESGNLSLDTDAAPGNDQYSLYIIGACTNQFITSTAVAWETDLAGGGSQTFGLRIYLGNLTVDYGRENTTINVTGTANT
jgi:hypothetical protein